MMELSIATAERMHELGVALGAQLGAGDVLALDGELGAGKTTLTRGIGEALGVRGTVTSPTFVLARTHPRESGPPLVHVDAYRLGSPVELDDLDLDLERSILVMEWASGMVDAIADEWLSLRIERPTGGDPAAEDEPRTVRVEPHGGRWADLRFLAEFAADGSAGDR